MKYIVDVDGTEVVVSLDADGVRVDGTLIDVSLSEIPGTPAVLVGTGDAIHRMAVQRREGRGKYSILTDRYCFEVEAVDERTRTIQEMTAKRSVAPGPSPLVAPMPGLVVRVDVRPGDVVQAGQGLIVIEAMKMENVLRATRSGIARDVRVEPGAVVEKGTVLVEME